jgi:hypothetical protein
MSLLKVLRLSAFTLGLAMLGLSGSRAVASHHAATATLSQPANDGNGPGGGDPNPDCPDCVVRAL